MLNKRKCRKFANPNLKMAAGNGILHADQIDYVIRTAVKIIDHHKTLVLYKKDALIKRNFIAVYRQLSGQLDYEKDGLKIVYPDTPDDVIAEGHTLHHCVGSYTERVANGECVILFLRKCSDETNRFTQ